MAITRAQQAKQMLREGGMTKKIKGQEHMLAYITPGEADKLVKLGGQETMTPEGIPAYPPGMGDPNYEGKTSPSRTNNPPSNDGDARSNYIANYVSKGIVKGGGSKIGTDAGGNPVYADAGLTKGQINAAKDFKQLQKFQSNFNNKTFFDNIPSTPKFLSKIFGGNTKYKREFLENNPQMLEYFNSLTEEEQESQKAMNALKGITNIDGQTYEDFLAYDKGAPGLKYSGDIGNLEKYVSSYKKNPDGTFQLTAKGNKIPNTYGYKEKIGGDGDGTMSDYERRLLELQRAVAANAAAITPEVEEDEIINYRLMADGGRAALAEGGMPYEGGIMDLESARQMYGLGKLVKKITRGVKKIAKSPIGKAALLYGVAAVGGSFGAGKGLFSKGMFNPGNIGRGLFGITAKGQALRGFPELAAQKGLFGKLGLTGGYGGLMPTALGGIAASTLGSYLLTPKEEDDDEELYAGADIDDPKTIMNNPYKYINRRLVAEGGSIDEPVAKKTMPLLDMDGQEMDLRAEGGFVPIGRMEKADDVPARLSKNEFVFTADAVRNAGEGDVDKGAEVMYNMMKNLESGGDVSEESQGLEGARDMFKTSQRLEEVL